MLPESNLGVKPTSCLLRSMGNGKFSPRSDPKISQNAQKSYVHNYCTLPCPEYTKILVLFFSFFVDGDWHQTRTCEIGPCPDPTIFSYI